MVEGLDMRAHGQAVVVDTLSVLGLACMMAQDGIWAHMVWMVDSSLVVHMLIAVRGSVAVSGTAFSWVCTEHTPLWTKHKWGGFSHMPVAGILSEESVHKLMASTRSGHKVVPAD